MAILQPLTGLTSFSVRWAHDPDPVVSDTDHASVSFLLSSSGAVGVDEHRYEYDSGTNTLTISECGNRTVTVKATAEAYDANAEASDILESIRTGIRSQSVTDALDAIGLSLQVARPIVDLPTFYDNRVVSAAVLELQFNARAVSSVAQPPGQGWISTVNGDNSIPIALGA